MAESEMAETADYDKSATPTAHASSHESGGSDFIDNLGPLTGLIISADGVITWQGATAASVFLFDTRVSGDTNPRFRIRSDGMLEWGSGSSSTDTTLFRQASNTLRSLDDFMFDSGSAYFYGKASGLAQLLYKALLDTEYAFRIYNRGELKWGSGSTTCDCELIRRAANILNTPDRFEVGTLGVANSAGGTTPGSCQNKAEIFDAAGNSLGFIAIYDAIT